MNHCVQRGRKTDTEMGESCIPTSWYLPSHVFCTRVNKMQNVGPILECDMQTPKIKLLPGFTKIGQNQKDVQCSETCLEKKIDITTL